MSYFSSFNYILYNDFENPSTRIILKNITSRVIKKLSPVDDKNLFYNYTMADGETIETISENLYGTVNYYWTFMLVNDRYDRFYDFPLSYSQLIEAIKEKYGSIESAQTSYRYFIRPNETLITSNSESNPDSDRDLNFIEINGATGPAPNFNDFSINGILYNFDMTFGESGATGISFPEYSNGVLMRQKISNYDYEVYLNEKKRIFKVIQSRYIDRFVGEFNNLIS